MKILIPIDARLLVNNVEYKGIGTGLFTQLRLASDETTVKSTGTEIETSGVYEFEITGTALTSYLELWICTTENGTYTKVKSWGGTDGIRQKEYLVYSALMNQTGTSAPVATVLENTTGQTLTWIYNSVGDYSAAGTFGLTKTFVMANQGLIITSDGFGIGAYNDTGVNIVIKTRVVVENGGGTVNGALTNTALEVRIYP